MIYSFLLHCKLISEIMYLKKNLFACGQRLTDLLIMYSSWLHAGCQLVNTAAVCFVHTCRFKCFFLFSFFFFKKKVFGNIMVSSFLRQHTRMMWKPQKHPTFTMLPLMQAQLLTRQGPNKLVSFIIFQNRKLI